MSERETPSRELLLVHKLYCLGEMLETALKQDEMGFTRAMLKISEGGHMGPELRALQPEIDASDFPVASAAYEHFFSQYEAAADRLNLPSGMRFAARLQIPSDERAQEAFKVAKGYLNARSTMNALVQAKKRGAPEMGGLPPTETLPLDMLRIYALLAETEGLHEEYPVLAEIAEGITGEEIPGYLNEFPRAQRVSLEGIPGSMRLAGP